MEPLAQTKHGERVAESATSPDSQLATDLTPALGVAS